MSKDWAYAKLTKEAAAGGGPDIWRSGIETENLIKGIAIGAANMKRALPVPLISAGLCGGVICTIGVIKFYNWITKMKLPQSTPSRETATAHKKPRETHSEVNTENQIDIMEVSE